MTGTVTGRALRHLTLYGTACLVALLATTMVIIALGHRPMEAYMVAFKDSIGTVGGLGHTINRMVPLLLTSLTFSLGHHAGLGNIGMDGQMYLGAILATGLALSLPEIRPFAPLMIALLLVVGAAGGALWSGIAGLFRVKWGVNEIFSTVMMNFVAFYLADFITTGPWNDPRAGEAMTYPIPQAYTLPKLVTSSGAHAGVIVACLIAVGFWWALYRTVPGYELRACGSNARAAKFSGIHLNRMQLVAMLAGGALSGLAGAVEVMGVHHRLILGLSPNFGMMAVLIAVLGRRHPILLIPVNFAVAVLVAGSDSLQRTAGFPSSAVFMLQALIVLVVLWIEAYVTRRERYSA